MNIFENYKATRAFIDFSNTLNDEDRKDFTTEVKKKFYSKVTSDEELESYKITVGDLEDLQNNFLHQKG